MARRTGRGGRLPRWFRGKKILDDISGSEHFELDSDMFKQRGLNVQRRNFDSLTDSERAGQLGQ
jgi:hypothetical protein